MTSCSGKLFQFPPSTTKTKGESTPLQSHIRGLPAGKETWVIVPLQRSSRGVPKMNGTLRNLSTKGEQIDKKRATNVDLEINGLLQPCSETGCLHKFDVECYVFKTRSLSS